MLKVLQNVNSTGSDVLCNKCHCRFLISCQLCKKNLHKVKVKVRTINRKFDGRL